MTLKCIFFKAHLCICLYLVGAKSDFPAAPGAASNATVVAGVADAICELSFEADVARGCKFHSGRALHFIPCADRLF